jgi:DNA-directed RNA polymerase specialized sigma24 family protein
VRQAHLSSIEPARPPRLDAQVEQQSTVELTVRAQGGDQEALEALCLRCLKSLTRFAAGRLPPAARGMVDTQDIVLEAVHRAMSKLPELHFQSPGTLIAYMRKILKNLIVDYVRTAVRRPYAHEMSKIRRPKRDATVADAGDTSAEDAS